MKTFSKTLIMTVAVLILSSAVIFAAVTAGEAREIAIKDAGVNAADITRIKVKNDIDNGVRVYDVEFYIGFDEYDYEIGYEDGVIYSKDMDIERSFPSAGGSVDRNGAISLALSDAGFLASDVTRQRVETDRDDGFTIYEVSFRNGEYDYDYDINAATGEIRSGEFEYNRRVSSNRNGTLIGEERALEIATPYIQYSNPSDVRIYRDYDDGIQKYELTAYIDGVQYELDIDAVTGRVLQYKFERF